MNTQKDLSVTRSPDRWRLPPLDAGHPTYATAISVSDPVAAIKTSNFDLDDMFFMNLTLFCCICLNDNYKTLECRQIQNIIRLIRT